jgi:hypothetical protein
MEVRHTDMSRCLATDPDLCAGLELQLSELAPASMKLIPAWNQWGEFASEPNRTAFSMSKSTGLSMYQYLEANPPFAECFGRAMRYYGNDDPSSLDCLIDALKPLDQRGARMIDLGGSEGQASQFIVKKTNHFHIQVQDLAPVVESATQALPANLRRRISFSAHDFFREQNASPVDAILIRWVLHNWSDSYCVKILKALRPALRSGTKIFIHEFVPDNPQVPGLKGRFDLRLDLIMLVLNNGRERSEAEFRDLLAAADERYVPTRVWKCPGSKMSVLEFTWTTGPATTL